ncbi:uncharacterized protein LOC131033262 [Cryptomeria japonica]|uniref:uncharacterized protein LOC131033262 n=1 Tax=Cryptomeria japonica TaxID=3369 RepID=UPI0027DA7E82|nr:uncharacterized protein LOC131033262 [Cryptomeria japonica]
MWPEIADAGVIEEYTQYYIAHPIPWILDPTEPMPPFEDDRALQKGRRRRLGRGGRGGGGGFGGGAGGEVFGRGGGGVAATNGADDGMTSSFGGMSDIGDGCIGILSLNGAVRIVLDAALIMKGGLLAVG